MAEDTRKSASDAQSSSIGDPNDRPYQGKLYEVFTPSTNPTPPPQQHATDNPNVMPGGAVNTAGGGRTDISAWEAARTIQVSEFQSLHQKPCVREAGLTGIGTGFGVGGLMAIWGRSVWRASSFFVYTTALVSLGSYQYCLIKRQLEREGMKRAVEVIDRKKAEREAKLEEARNARRKLKEEKDQQEEERLKKERGFLGKLKFW